MDPRIGSITTGLPGAHTVPDGGSPDDIEANRQPQSPPPSPSPINTGPPENEADTPTSDSASSPTSAPITRTSTAASLPLASSLSLPSELLLIGTLCTAQIFTQAGLSQTLALLHIINTAFTPRDTPISFLSAPPDLPWLIAGYSLTVGTFILPSGRLGDSLGHKLIFLTGLAWFALWSVIAGCVAFVPAPEEGRKLFVVARVFQGIGPALMLPNALAMLGRTYPPSSRRKALAFSLFVACAPGGSVLGAASTSVIALGWWPWAFWGFAIALVGAGILAWWVIPPCELGDGGKCEKAETGCGAGKSGKVKYWINELDLPGSVTGVSALVLFNFAWNQAPVAGWGTAEIIVPLVLGLLLFLVFFYIEARISQCPLFPSSVLQGGEVSFVLAAVACGWACFGIWVYYTWQFIELLKGASPLLASAWFSPVAVSGAVAAVCTGFMLGRLRPAVVMTMALSAFTIGAILMATVPLSQGYWGQLFVMMIITPWGMDMSFPASTIILSDAVGRRHQGIAASLVNTVVNYSISLGLGIAGTVEVHVNRGGGTVENLLRGYRGALYVGIGLAVLGLGVSLVLLGRALLHERRHKTESQKGARGRV